ncbi:shikimate kinase [Janibacter massiliensis]|uniref:shikimate kinase n=1 Tax=Janibacter massiliensis TaxID=2058291 RepID=UPI0018FEEBC8|nr:shikimate kinase [Janibacter massiliensis]
MTVPDQVVLIGPPGAGKSTTGARVARALGLEILDTDAMVEQRAGKPVADIFVEDGEPVFRDLEREVTLEALRHGGVVCLGGGGPMTPEIAAALDGRTVVLLDVGIADAARRVGFDRSRPLLAVNPRARWIELMAARRPTYERLATRVVDTAGRTPAQVASAVLEAIGADDREAGR